ISSTDLAWMVQNNHLSCEASSLHGWIIFAVTSHIATTDIFDRHVLDIEAHIVPRKGFTQCFMVHFYRLHLRCYVDWSKGDHHARFENTSLHTTHRDSTNTTNFIDILERQTQGEISMVIPRSRSAFSLSKTQAYLKEPFPILAASFSNFSIVLLSVPPHL
ncbi:hypothetical protein K5549_020956, partial [Capra hircus]